MEYEIGKRLDKIEAGVQLLLEKIRPEIFEEEKKNESAKSAI